ncbi:MAG: cell division protein SepF [Clostridia bacterium]|nr:cell division protein SepF [Clostridia bacterium]
MALKESIKQLGRFIGVLQPQQPYYDPYGYPVDDGGYYGGQYGGQYDGGYGQQDPYGYGGRPPMQPQYQPQQQPQYQPQQQPQHQAQFGGQRGYYAEEEYPPQPTQQPMQPPMQQSMQRPPQQGFGQPTQQPQPFTVFGNNQRGKQPPNNVVPMPRHEDVGMPQSNKHSEIIVCVRSLDDCQEIINALLESKSVFINMEPADDMLAQRVIDILGGASFALRGTMTKISHRAYLVAPNSVDVVNSQPPMAGPAFRGEFSAHRR